MRLAWLTDIHLNFVDEWELARFTEALATSDSDGVLIGGDIAQAPTLADSLRDFAARVDLPIYFVLGNHDYYLGSLAEVRAEMTALAAEVDSLHYLPTTGAVELTASTALIGIGGWGDGRLGNLAGSRVRLNDYVLIDDLAGLSGEPLAQQLAELGHGEAAALRAILAPAAHRFENLLVLTHVPPFREACWHQGEISNPQWLPHFTCKATGDVLRDIATAHPECRLEVLCGHTHSAGEAELLPNLHLRTGRAVYGSPVIQDIIEIA